MKNQALLSETGTSSLRGMRFWISTALAAGLLAGCSAHGPHPAKFAAGAQSAMDKGDATKAVTLAEQAVQADPRNAAFRLLLGNAYLRAGRFESAHQTYNDAMDLGEDGGKAALSLALADIAMGKLPEAVDTLNTYRDGIPAADFGLAMAMAGQTQQGVAVLTDALRRGENTPKVRQNLAFAYALSGSWREAKIMAEQDVPADQLNARLQDWAAMGKPEDVRLRVATLLRVPLRGDEGQPAALALTNSPAPEQLSAEAATKADAAPAFAKAAIEELPAVDAAPAPAPTVADASSVPAPAQLAAIDMPPSSVAAPAQLAPTPREVAAGTRPYRVVGEHKVRQDATVSSSGPVALAAPSSNGTHVVQLGSFRSSEGAQRAWRHFVKRDPSLQAHASLITQVTVNGHQFWRVQAAGFGGYANARSMCGSVRARGGACLVMAASRAVSPQGRPAEARFARR